MSKIIRLTETVLRDGQQSQIATRMSTEDMLPILETLDQAGFHALEVWGGATFDSCIRFLNEDPWERLRQIRAAVKDTKLQMLLRGQNLLGYRNYADDVVRLFVEKSVQNGIDIIRVFDALNDVRNMKTSIEATKLAGGHCQTAISYTTSPVHTVDYYVDLVGRMAEFGADSICIKDMAGVLTPQTGYELVSRIKEKTDLSLEVHTHATSGISEMTYLKVAEAGADIIDTCLSSFSGGTSQPAAFEQKNNWTHFEVTGEKKGTLLFYTGALVEPQAYAKLADGLAKEGIEVYIISSQLNLPVLDNGTMATIVKEEHLDKVFVGGHSLGGVVSTIEAKKLNEMGQVAGLILLASYPDQSTDISETQIPVLSITASNDKILKQEKYEDAKSRLPESTLYTSIEGGNHSGFGLYGQQKGDGEATMSAEEQQKQLVQIIKQFIVSH